MGTAETAGEEGGQSAEVISSSAATQEVSQISASTVDATVRSYVFTGRVHPERYDIGISSFPELQTSLSDGAWLRCRFQLSHSQMSVQVQTNSTLPLLEIKSLVNDYARIPVDALGYIWAAGLDIEIVTCVDHQGVLHVFNTAFDGLRGHEGPERDRHEHKVLIRLITMSFTDLGIRQALIQFRHAIREPVDTAVSCYRAVEAIRQNYLSGSSDDGSARVASWDRLRAATGVEESETRWLEELSTPGRHGESRSTPNQDRERALRIARKVIEGHCLRDTDRT